MQRRLPRETVKTSTEIPLSVPPRNPTWPWPWEQGAPFSVAASGPGAHRTTSRAPHRAHREVRFRNTQGSLVPSEPNPHCRAAEQGLNQLLAPPHPLPRSALRPDPVGPPPPHTCHQPVPPKHSPAPWKLPRPLPGHLTPAATQGPQVLQSPL